MDINEFFNSGNKQTQFIDRLCAVLDIKDTSRVKIVGVYSGSTIVVTSIFPPATSSNSTTEKPLTQIQTQLTNSIQSGALSSAMAQAGVGSVLSAEATYYAPADSNSTTPTNPTSSGSESIKWYFIVAGAGGIVVVVGLIL